MALPTKEKTWLYAVNQAVGSGVDPYAANRNYLWTLKETLKGFATNPWTVWGSCDNSNVDNGGGTDYWVTQNNLNWNTDGNAHSWIVLRQTGLGANVYLCIDLNGANSWPGSATFSLTLSQVTFAADGTTTNAPTTTDGINLSAREHGGNSSTGGWTGYMHVWQSNDGECTRWILNRGGNVYNLTIMDKVKDPFSSWSVPVAFGQRGDDTNTGRAAFGVWNDSAPLQGRLGGTNFSNYLTCEGWSSIIGAELTVADEDTGDWPIMPMGLASATVGFRGYYKGSLYDLWWGATALTTGDTYPDNATKQFVQFDDMIFPWNGTTPLIA